MAREATINYKVMRAMEDAIARALFVDAWASRQEQLAEEGKKHVSLGGKELMDIAPKTNAEAKRAAQQLVGRIEQLNGWGLAAIFNQAVKQGGSDDPKKFGHYLAMESLGHGVAWTDDEPEFGLPDVLGKLKPFKLPHIEFFL